MNLQQIKKENGLTNADIARSLGCSTSKVSTILQGRHIKVYRDTEIAQLAKALSNYNTVTFERCWRAMCESYNQWCGTSGMEHQRADEFRAAVQAEMQEKMPDLGIQVEEPREMTTIESVLVVPEERRLR